MPSRWLDLWVWSWGERWRLEMGHQYHCVDKAFEILMLDELIDWDWEGRGRKEEIQRLCAEALGGVGREEEEPEKEVGKSKQEGRRKTRQVGWSRLKEGKVMRGRKMRQRSRRRMEKSAGSNVASRSHKNENRDEAQPCAAQSYCALFTPSVFDWWQMPKTVNRKNSKPQTTVYLTFDFIKPLSAIQASRCCLQVLQPVCSLHTAGAFRTAEWKRNHFRVYDIVIALLLLQTTLFLRELSPSNFCFII